MYWSTHKAIHSGRFAFKMNGNPSFTRDSTNIHGSEVVAGDAVTAFASIEGNLPAPAGVGIPQDKASTSTQ